MVQQNYSPPLGFVIALSGTIVHRDLPPRREWLIASRWGEGGSYLSVARTFVAVEAAATAPPDLVPRWSALALLESSSDDSSSPSFIFTDQRPPGLVLAGRFAPSLGKACVEGNDKAVRLWGDVHCIPRKARRHLQFAGIQIEWIGEFIESRL